MLLGSQALLIARYMDLLSVRQKLTATNIANADTPGYLARDIDFGEEMARALEQSPEGVAPPLIVRQVEGLPIKNDGNNVSLDRELRILWGSGYPLLAGLLNAQEQHPIGSFGDPRRSDVTQELLPPL